MQIDKIKEKTSGTKGLKERVASAPKQLLRRGLDDGTERLRGQFRDASQRGQRDDYGGDQIEDAAWGGTRRAERSAEKLLKKMRFSRGRTAEPVPDADFPEAERPPDTPAPADLPKPERETDRVRIKTKEAAVRRADGPLNPSDGRQPPSHPFSEQITHARTEPPQIKTREYARQGAFMHRDTALTPVESPAVQSTPRSKILDVRQMFRRGESPAPSMCQEAPASQTRGAQMPSSPQSAAGGNSLSQRGPDIKTKGGYLHQQTTIPAESSAQDHIQGGRRFVREQGRKKAVRRTEARRAKMKTASELQASGKRGTFHGNTTGGSFQPSPPDIQASTPPLQGRDIPGPASSKAENPVTRAVKQAASKEKKAIKASRAGIKNSRQAVKAADRSAKAARKSAQVAAKAPQRAVKAARATAKAGAATTREAANASLAAIKAAIAAAQELIAALAAGGWAVVAVVLVLCMVGLLIASPFGLFFSGAEGNGSGIPQAVVQLNGEFTARIEQIKEDTPHDVLDLDNEAIAAVLDNWRNVLAVYAVRASTDGSSPSGLDGLTAENLALLREVFWDMNQISSFTETVLKGEDETETVLHITAVVKTP